MIRVSVLYPYDEAARFDHDYYRETHLPLVKQLLGAACERYSIDRGVAGGAGGPPVFKAACHIFTKDVSTFVAALDAESSRIMGDIPNFTDIEPIIQISEVVVE